MRGERRKLLLMLKKAGRSVPISEIREGFEVDDRTLRRWLLALRDEGRVEAIGDNKGRRYRLAPSRETGPGIEDGTLEELQRELLREAIRDAASGRTLTVLLAERVRELLPAPARAGFIKTTLSRLRAMTTEEAEALEIPPMMFQYWRRAQTSAQCQENQTPPP